MLIVFDFKLRRKTSKGASAADRNNIAFIKVRDTENSLQKRNSRTEKAVQEPTLKVEQKVTNHFFGAYPRLNLVKRRG